MSSIFFGCLILLGAALQFWAAVASHRRVGPLRSLQARQLERMVGRRGVVVVFAVFGALLTFTGLTIVLRALLAL